MDVEVFERVEALRQKPVRSAEDAANLEEAARILGALVKLRERAEGLVAPPQASAGMDLAGVTLHEAARLVLEDAGTPLHVRDLGARIKGRGWRHPRSTNARPEQILFQLAARLPKYPETFRRVGPNTFALAKWGDVPRTGHPLRLPHFRGPGGPVGRQAGDMEPPVDPWRSS